MAELKNIRIAVSGIYDYAREELESLNVPLPGQGAPEWAGGKQFYKVYRPAPVLACAVQKFASLPLTHHHPNGLVNGVNFRDLTVGWTGETPVVDYIPDADEVGIRSTCILYDDEALRAYRNGEVQLSPGYTAVFEWKQGTTHGGVPYDIVMKEILDVNHVALLPAGRGGEYAAVLDGAGAKPSVFEIARAKDGAPEGNDNASKEHEKEDEEGLDEKEKAHLRDLLKSNAVDFPVVEFSEENYKKYLATPIDTPLGKVKLGENQFEKLKAKNRTDLIGAIHDTLEKPCFIAEEKGGTVLYVKSFIQNDKQKDIMSVVIKRDGLNISISTHEEREPQILSKIKKAGVLSEAAGDDGAVRDDRVADTARAVSLTITDNPAPVKSVFEIARAKDGAPDGNDNASKEHESREEETAKKRVFGTEYKGYTGTRAIDKLLQEKQGFVQNAFSREDIGGIDVVYGKITDPKTLKGYGLAKIFAKHPEMTPALISEIIEQGNLEKTYNGYNLNHGGFVVGLNNGYNENGKRVITSNWIVTSFKNEKEKVNDAIASAAAFPPSAGRPGNLFTDEIVIENPYSVKSVFDIARGSVFERAAV